MTLSQWSMLLGAALAASGAFMLLFPSRAAEFLKAYPRHVWLGRIVSLLAWIGAGAAAMDMGWDFLEPYKKYTPAIVAVCIPLTWWALDNLLACRAWGGILCLFPLWFLAASRMNYSPWRLIPVCFAYLCIIKGMLLILYPWYLRRELAWTAESPLRIRAVGAARALLGAVFLALALTALK